MDREELNQWLIERDMKTETLDAQYDAAILGIVWRGNSVAVVYDVNKILDLYIKGAIHLTPEEARAKYKKEVAPLAEPPAPKRKRSEYSPILMETIL